MTSLPEFTYTIAEMQSWIAKYLRENTYLAEDVILEIASRYNLTGRSMVSMHGIDRQTLVDRLGEHGDDIFGMVVELRRKV